MLLGREQNIIGHELHRVRATAEAHLRAYAPDDIEFLMKTVSPHGGIWAGAAPPEGAVLLRTPKEIRETYVKLLDTVNVSDKKIISVALCTDWYVFFDSQSTILDKASGKTFQTRSVTIFGNDNFGTAIDMAWPFGLVPGAKPGETPAVPAGKADFASHQKRMTGLAAADNEAASAGIADHCFLFLPCFDPDDERLEVMVTSPASYKDYLKSLRELYEVDQITPSNLVVADQYVFSETQWQLTSRRDGKPLTVQYALVEAQDAEGKIGGMLGFATRR